MLILIFLVISQTTHNEGRPRGATTETVKKLDPGMYNRTSQLINLVSRLDDGDPVDPMWTDFRKQYYPDRDSYWEDFNLKFNDTAEKPLDLYWDMVKLLVDTNQQGITGTVQQFATTLAPAPLRKNIRRQRVRNTEVLDQYRRKSKKGSRSTSSSGDDDDSDDDSDESLGYRRTISSQEDDYDRLENIRRMLDIDKILPEAKVSELNFEKVPSSGEDKSTHLRSLYMGEDSDKQDILNKDSHKYTISFDSQDAEDKKTKNRDKPKEKKKEKHSIGWDEKNVPWDKKTSNNWDDSTNKDWDNLGSNKDKKSKGALNDDTWSKDNKNKKTDWYDETLKSDAWGTQDSNRNKKTNWNDELLTTDTWEKQDREKKKDENDRYKIKLKNTLWDIDGVNESKKFKMTDWEQPTTMQKSINDDNKRQKNHDYEWTAPNKKNSWDSYGNKKIKDYDDNDNSKKEEKEKAKDKNDLDSPGNIGWDDYGPTKKNKNDLRSNTKNDEWENIGRSKKDIWEKKSKKKTEVRDSKRTKKDDLDNSSKKKSSWDDTPLQKDNWDDKLTKKDKWNDTPMKKDKWDDEPPMKNSWNDKSTKSNWDDKSMMNDKSDGWDDKSKKKNSWDDKPVKKGNSDNWSGQWEKTTKRWREEKTTRDWDPPPTRKKKYDNDYYERPRNKHGKRDRDMLNVRTPIPFIGKKGIYEDI